MSLRFPYSIERFLRRETLLMAGILIAGIHALAPCAWSQQISPVPIDCGNYTLVQGSSGAHCHRSAVIPWYVGTPGVWETELVFTGSPAGLAYSFGEDRNEPLQLWDTRHGSFSAESVLNLWLGDRQTYRARIIGRGYCESNCEASGSITVGVDGQDAASLDAATILYSYRYMGGTGRIVTQTIQSAVFEDQASSKWTAFVTETPRSRQSEPGANVMAVVVKSLAVNQNIRVTVRRDGSSLPSATAVISANEAGYGLRGFMLSDLLGVELPANVGMHFTGSITFESEQGGKIVPVVLQTSGTGLTAISVNPEQ